MITKSDLEIFGKDTAGDPKALEDIAKRILPYVTRWQSGTATREDLNSMLDEFEGGFVELKSHAIEAVFASFEHILSRIEHLMNKPAQR